MAGTYYTPDGDTVVPFGSPIENRVQLRDAWECWYCGSLNPGKNSGGVLVVSCIHCNGSRKKDSEFVSKNIAYTKEQDPQTSNMIIRRYGKMPIVVNESEYFYSRDSMGRFCKWPEKDWDYVTGR